VGGLGARDVILIRLRLFRTEQILEFATNGITSLGDFAKLVIDGGQPSGGLGGSIPVPVNIKGVLLSQEATDVGSSPTKQGFESWDPSLTK
jgi:hypothetical protein